MTANIKETEWLIKDTTDGVRIRIRQTTTHQLTTPKVTTRITQTGMLTAISIGATTRITIRVIHRITEPIKIIIITKEMDQTNVLTVTPTIVITMGTIITRITRIITEETEITEIQVINPRYTLCEGAPKTTRGGATPDRNQTNKIIITHRAITSTPGRRIMKMCNGIITLKDPDPEMITKEGKHHLEVTNKKMKIMTGYLSVTT